MRLKDINEKNSRTLATTVFISKPCREEIE